MNNILTVEEKALPFLRWAGSKRQIIPHLYPYWSDGKYKRYIEPFLGAAHLYFSINETCSILSDINSELIITYSIIKDYPVTLHEAVTSRPADKDYYYELRSVDPSTLSPFDRAARFIYLNRYCFNGLYRTDLKGRFNVPFSPERVGKISSVDKWIKISEKLKNALILCGDFEDILLNNIKCGDFVYLDPPYLTNNKSFTEYSSTGFNKFDLERLVKTIIHIDEVGATFVLSYVYNEQVLNLFKEWGLEIVEANRKISSSISTRISVKELIISNIKSKRLL